MTLDQHWTVPENYGQPLNCNIKRFDLNVHQFYIRTQLKNVDSERIHAQRINTC
ncbi:hypothetical protein V144x_18850 [Gimesia aquarii]|uniref:Uncharacterized protein n=1 Tax=Gimesia aquarii TaxID=2527964 RepID=A0A517VTX5_9PLAN|nr:hypothetical protein V144x_18850 [Gimesia aquarii]